MYELLVCTINGSIQYSPLHSAILLYVRVLETSYPFHVPARERLVVREDDGVVLGVGLVRARRHPSLVRRHLRAEPEV